jgi:ribosomal protein S18 acetylase RimI-like enzyme
MIHPVDTLAAADRVLLDNPVWSALSTSQAAFAVGGDLARRFLPEVGPFAGIREPSQEAWHDLRSLLGADGQVAVLGATPPTTSPAIRVTSLGTILQMLAPRPEPVSSGPWVELEGDDAPAMLQLATLTKPGPFASRTHELGSFIGIREGDEIVAMAGERMRFGRCVEISGVCVHPAHRGTGLAARLTMAAAGRIAARGGIPFLHVFEHNTAAVALYGRLGFRTRTTFALHRIAAA